VSMNFGIALVNNRIREVTDETRDRAEALVRKTAFDIEADAKANIVAHNLILTGFMLSSVKAVQVDALSWMIVVGAFYGVFHEFGTSRMPARPYLGPAVEANRSYFDQAVGDLLDE